ncbi:MAG: glycosyltransferase family 4 protein [Methylophilaceae bacterium]|nr:glycosyltransferase family 4 protein [Methylophilaceae bacterium]
MIAIVYPQFYGVGGIARYLDSFLANLPDGHPPIYLITGDEHRQPIAYEGVDIIHIPFTSNRFVMIIWMLKARKILLQLYKQRKISWVNLHIPPLIPGLLLPKKIPLLLTAHTTYLGMSGNFYKTKYFDSQWNQLALSIKSRIELVIFQRTKKMITLTEQGQQEVLAYGYKNPIVVIPNGVDLTKFTPNSHVEKDVDVLFCGRIERRKGSHGMITLCHHLVAAKANIKIVIVGYGEDEAWVKAQLAPYAKNITMTGQVSFSEAIEFYQRSRVYASTSYYEGLPGTCLEAMAMQLPVVVWDFLFYRGLVNDAETGRIVPVDDFERMATQIIDLLEHPEISAQLGESARQLLAQRYGWDRLAKEVLLAFN